MNSVRIALSSAGAACTAQRTGTASVEGVIVRLGTNEMISGVDLELTEASPAAPPNGATGAPPTPALFTAKSGSDGKFAIRNVPSGTYKLAAASSGEFSDAA